MTGAQVAGSSLESCFSELRVVYDISSQIFSSLPAFEDLSSFHFSANVGNGSIYMSAKGVMFINLRFRLVCTACKRSHILMNIMRHPRSILYEE